MCLAAKFVKHGKCLLCLDDIVKRRLPHLTEQERELTEPTEEDIAAAPTGNLFHRITACPRVVANCKSTRPNLEESVQLGPPRPGDIRIERALFPSTDPPTPSPMLRELFIGLENPHRPCSRELSTLMVRGSIFLAPWLEEVGPSRLSMKSARCLQSQGASPPTGSRTYLGAKLGRSCKPQPWRILGRSALKAIANRASKRARVV